MDQPLILIDVPNLAYRNYHALRHTASYKHPVIRGILRDLTTICRFYTGQMVFCFDSEVCSRKEEYPAYKATRPDSPDRRAVKREMRTLAEVLHHIGYRNSILWPGAEADDVIAQVCLLNSEKAKVIISNDSDLNQLLNNWTTIWNPLTKFKVDEATVFERHAIHPHEWVRFKSLTGCATDNIEGVFRMGTVTATKVLRMTLPPDSLVHRIVADNKELLDRNERLIRLPYHRLTDGDFALKKDCTTGEKWDQLCSRFDCDSLIGRFPG